MISQSKYSAAYFVCFFFFYFFYDNFSLFVQNTSLFFVFSILSLVILILLFLNLVFPSFFKIVSCSSRIFLDTYFFQRCFLIYPELLFVLLEYFLNLLFLSIVSFQAVLRTFFVLLKYCMANIFVFSSTKCYSINSDKNSFRSSKFFLRFFFLHSVFFYFF